MRLMCNCKRIANRSLLSGKYLQITSRPIRIDALLRRAGIGAKIPSVYELIFWARLRVVTATDLASFRGVAMTRYHRTFASGLFAILALAFGTDPIHARPTPTGTAFTYQGQLKLGDNNVNSTADFQFSLWDAASGPSQIGGIVPVNNVTISNGLFSADIDFGGGAFGTNARWLQIAVRSPAGSGSFTTLVPRQRIQPTPVSQFALNVDGTAVTNLNASNITTGTLPNSALSGTYTGAVNFSNAGNVFSGSGASLTSLTATNLASGTVPSARLSGTYSSALTFSNASNSFSGSGAGLTSLNASNLSNGTIPSARMSGAYSGITGVGSLASGTWQGSTIGPGFGGTGQSSFAAGDLLYASGATALSKLGIGGPNQFLKSNGSTPAWGAIASAELPVPLSISGSVNSGAVLSATNTSTIGVTRGLIGTADASSGVGVFGDSTTTTGSGAGVHGRSLSDFGRAVRAEAASASVFAANYGVYATSAGGLGTAVYGSATSATGTTYGVRGRTQSASAGAAGVYGESYGGVGTTYGVLGFAEGSSVPVQGSGAEYGVKGIASSHDGIAVNGYASNPLGGWGVIGRIEGLVGAAVAAIAADNSAGSNAFGMRSDCYGGQGTAVYGISQATSGTNYGGQFLCQSGSGFGLLAKNNAGGTAIYAETGGPSNAIYGKSTNGDALVGETQVSGKSSVFGYTGTAGANGGYFNSAANSGTGKGVVGQSNSSSGYGVYAIGNTGATGTKSFQIDHPLDPTHKYLNHYSAEGPQPLNIYTGNVFLNSAGEAWVTLPDYFESINTDYRYQLTCIGGYAPVYVATEIANNQFQIAGGKPGLKISWEVKAVRNDPWVRQHGAPDEITKPADKQGTYLHPELYGMPASLSENHSSPATPGSVAIPDLPARVIGMIPGSNP